MAGRSRDSKREARYHAAAKEEVTKRLLRLGQHRGSGGAGRRPAEGED